MPEPSARAQIPRRVSATWLFATSLLLGLIAASQHYFEMGEPGLPKDWQTISHSLARELPNWLMWALAVPATLWLRRHVIGSERSMTRQVTLHVAVGLILVILHIDIVRLLQHFFGYPASFPMLFQVVGHRANWVGIAWTIATNSLTYILVLSTVLAWEYYNRFREQTITASLLARELAEAKLLALKNQLQPHFLFNALNSVAMLVREGRGSEAVTMLSGLSDLLRQVLAEGRTPDVTLDEELQFVARYLAIEQIRFHDRLTSSIEADESTRAAIVPHLILQPVVENALRHGIAKRAAAGRLEIEAHRTGDDLVIRVRDDGPGPSGSSSGVGIGLANVRNRLIQRFGSRARLSLIGGPEGGAIVTLTLPWTLERAASSP
ncbi:MAG: histidine kinase [Gemmatimonadota bacterium]